MILILNLINETLKTVSLGLKTTSPHEWSEERAGLRGKVENMIAAMSKLRGRVAKLRLGMERLRAGQENCFTCRGHTVSGQEEFLSYDFNIKNIFWQNAFFGR